MLLLLGVGLPGLKGLGPCFSVKGGHVEPNKVGSGLIVRPSSVGDLGAITGDGAAEGREDTCRSGAMGADIILLTLTCARSGRSSDGSGLAQRCTERERLGAAVASVPLKAS